MIASSTRSQTQVELAVPAPLGTVTAWLLRRCLTIFAWFLGLATLVVLVLVPPMLQQFQSDITGSVWAAFAGRGPSWFVFSLGIMTTQYLPVFVAQGVSRRRFNQGSGLALAGTALLAGVMVAVGYLVEAGLFHAYGIDTAVRGSSLAAGNPLMFVVVESWLRSLLFGLTGVLVGLAYYRFGGWLGTALLPFTAIVPLGMGLIALTQSLEVEVFDWVGKTPATTTGLGWLVAFEVVILLICQQLSSGARVRAKRD